MNSTVFFIFICCFITANGVPVEVDVEGQSLSKDIDEINLNEIGSLGIPSNGPGCPNISQICRRMCPVGYVINSYGCKTCTCKENGIFEGDILVNPATMKGILENYATGQQNIRQRGALPNRYGKWIDRSGANVVIGYVFDETVSSKKRERILEAISEYNKKTCIRFVPRTTQSDYINFIGTGGCSSYVGRTGGMQPVSIGRNCDYQLGTIIHELMHALGFWHEHSRGDRDNYVTIKTQNIRSGYSDNFLKQTMFWNPFGSPYDLKSVMQYGGYFFAKGSEPTIVDKKGNPVVAQRVGFSEQDLFQINTKYECPGQYFKISTTPSTTTTTTTTLPPCVNQYNVCDYWQQRGYCPISSFVKENCVKSCTNCAVSTTAATTTKKSASSPKPNIAPSTDFNECVDKSPFCQYWREQNYCTTTYVGYMKTHCAKSCGFCKPAELLSTDSNPCKDNSRYCKQWADLMYCTEGKYAEATRQFCKKTCTGRGVTGLCN